MNRIHLAILVSLLTGVGLFIFGYKVLVLGFPLSTNVTTDVWNVEARVSLKSEKGPVRISMYVPQSIKPYIITDESFIAPSYGVTKEISKPNRVITWSIREADGVQTLYYRSVIRQMEEWEIEDILSADVPDEFRTTLPTMEGAFIDAGMAFLGEVKAKTADEETLVLTILEELLHPQSNSNAAILLSQATPIEVAAQVLALDGIHSRIVHGVELSKTAQTVELKDWLEVYGESGWIAYDLDTSQRGIPENYLPWWRGNTPLFSIEGAEQLDYRISVSPNREQAIKAAIARSAITDPGLLKFSLFSLPIETQVVYHILVLIPIGAFLLIILRNIVGVKTFGTFMPILIALAFRETQLLWGVILFSALIALGLAVRFYLEHLQLLLVPRLGAVLIVVVLMMGIVSIISHHLGIVRGLSVALFPMVIVTMTIERMSIVWDERGAAEALQQALGSIAVAALTYLIMSLSIVDHIFFTFPELLLVLLAMTILLGRYSGYRLLEIRRFQSLLQKSPSA